MRTLIMTALLGIGTIWASRQMMQRRMQTRGLRRLGYMLGQWFRPLRLARK